MSTHVMSLVMEKLAAVSRVASSLGKKHAGLLMVISALVSKFTGSIQEEVANSDMSVSTTFTVFAKAVHVEFARGAEWSEMILRYIRPGIGIMIIVIGCWGLGWICGVQVDLIRGRSCVCWWVLCRGGSGSSLSGRVHWFGKCWVRISDILFERPRHKIFLVWFFFFPFETVLKCGVSNLT